CALKNPTAELLQNPVLTDNALSLEHARNLLKQVEIIRNQQVSLANCYILTGSVILEHCIIIAAAKQSAERIEVPVNHSDGMLLFFSFKGLIQFGAVNGGCILDEGVLAIRSRVENRLAVEHCRVRHRIVPNGGIHGIQIMQGKMKLRHRMPD